MKVIVETPVDITNVFLYDNKKYKISSRLKQYTVKNYPIQTNDKYNNWTNECEMDSVIAIDNDGRLKFLDQNGQDITVYIEQV